MKNSESYIEATSEQSGQDLSNLTLSIMSTLTFQRLIADNCTCVLIRHSGIRHSGIRHFVGFLPKNQHSTLRMSTHKMSINYQNVDLYYVTIFLWTSHLSGSGSKWADWILSSQEDSMRFRVQALTNHITVFFIPYSKCSLESCVFSSEWFVSFGTVISKLRMYYTSPLLSHPTHAHTQPYTCLPRMVWLLIKWQSCRATMQSVRNWGNICMVVVGHSIRWALHVHCWMLLSHQIFELE